MPGVAVATGLCATTGATQSVAASRGLTPLLAPGAATTVASRRDGTVTLTAAPATPVAAPIDAAVSVAAGSLRLDGDGADSGVSVVITGVSAAAAVGPVHRGDPLGSVASAPLAVSVSID